MKANVFNEVEGKKLKVAIVQARFNSEITDGLLAGANRALKDSGVKEKNIKIFQVPGSFEIPIACKKIADLKKFDGIITLGAVVKGETAHFEYISKSAIDGVMRTSLDSGMPVSLGVITTYDLDQARKRAEDDENNKGYEAAMSLVELIKKLGEI